MHRRGTVIQVEVKIYSTNLANKHQCKINGELTKPVLCLLLAQSVEWKLNTQDLNVWKPVKNGSY
jgi:hypothetical protein